MTQNNITIIIPCLNSVKSLGYTLESLDEAKRNGVIDDIIVVDGGSHDATIAIAKAAHCTVINCAPSRGGQLRAGADAAKTSWLLFIHSDTKLQKNWWQDRYFQTRIDNRAAYFHFKLNASGWRPRILEILVKLRNIIFALPYGDQGLLISRSLYDDIGGYPDWPLMEDVGIIEKLGRRRLKRLQASATTEATRYANGYTKRIIRNLRCLILYKLGHAPDSLKALYERSSS